MNSSKLSTFTFTLRVLTFRLILLVVVLLAVMGLTLHTSTAFASDTQAPPEFTLTGRIVGKTTDTFSLRISTETRLVRVVTTTKFIQDDHQVGFSDLQLDMVVVAHLRYNTAITDPGANRWEAMEVNLPPSVTYHNETIGGLVNGKTNDYLSLRLPNGSLRYMKVTTATVFIKNGQPATFADLQVGAAVQAVIKVSSPSNSAEALRIYWQVNVAATEIWRGAVVAKGTDYFYIKVGDGSYRRVTVTSTTVFVQDGQPATFAALMVGSPVEVEVKLMAGSTNMGAAVRVTFPPTRPTAH